MPVETCDSGAQRRNFSLVCITTSAIQSCEAVQTIKCSPTAKGVSMAVLQAVLENDVTAKLTILLNIQVKKSDASVEYQKKIKNWPVSCSVQEIVISKRRR